MQRYTLNAVLSVLQWWFIFVLVAMIPKFSFMLVWMLWYYVNDAMWVMFSCWHHGTIELYRIIIKLFTEKCYSGKSVMLTHLAKITHLLGNFVSVRHLNFGSCSVQSWTVECYCRAEEAANYPQWLVCYSVNSVSLTTTGLVHYLQVIFSAIFMQHIFYHECDFSFGP